MSPKPALGYASRTDAVLALRAQGCSTRDIANRLDIETKTVTALEVSATRSRQRRSTEDPTGRLVLVPVDILNSMRRAASRRGLTPNQLARRIVEAVVDEGLIDAVLDDAEASCEPLRETTAHREQASCEPARAKPGAGETTAHRERSR